MIRQGRELQLLPPAPHLCQECAVEHDADEPHNALSLYYQIKFYKDNGRWPTWKDALAHCNEEVQTAWTRMLMDRGAWKEPND